jgi:iron(III) transport system substrate-binding protein
MQMARRIEITRRDILKYTGALSALPLLGRVPAFAQGSEALAKMEEAANKEGRVVMYYSGVPVQRAQAIVDAWTKRYPKIKMEFVEVGGSATIGRVTQESLAGGPTCDLTTNTLGAVDGLIKQNLLRTIDMAPFGVKPSYQAQPNPYVLATHGTTYCTMFNTKKVASGEAPKKVEDLLDPKWKGRWGTWNRPLGIMTLMGAWGEEKTTEYVKKLSQNQPRLFRSGAAWTDAVTAGEIDLVNFIPTYTTIAPREAKAPVDISMVEPISLSLVYGVLPKEGRHPNAAQLLVAWLAGSEGSGAVEKASGRGNPFDPNSETAKQLVGRQLAALDAKLEGEKSEYLAKLEDRYAEMLQGR